MIRGIGGALDRRGEAVNRGRASGSACGAIGNAFRTYGKQAAWERLATRAYYRAGWTDAYGYLLAATGRIEIMLDAIMEPYDCGPFVPIFKEAGGYFGDWRGNRTIFGREGLATNGALQEEVLGLLAM